MVLSAHGGVCRQLLESADDIKRLWAAESVQPTDLSYWDLSHVRNSLRERTEEIKVLIHRGCGSQRPYVLREVRAAQGTSP
jgi:hypothetical protein